MTNITLYICFGLEIRKSVSQGVYGVCITQICFPDVFSAHNDKLAQTRRIVALRDAGHTWMDIFHLLGGQVSLSVIRFRYRRYKKDGILTDRPGRGRKKTLTDSQERIVIQHVMDNRQQTLAQIKQFVNEKLKIQISCATLCQLMKKYGVKSFVPVRTPH